MEFDNETIATIHKRRSVRSYQPQQIAGQELEIILEAGRTAPSGGNNQTSHFTVIQNAGLLARLRQEVADAFSAMEANEHTYKSLRHSIERAKKGGYDFCFAAPALVIAGNVRGYGNAMADCAVALENMMLAATSIGVGSCWINQLRWLDENPAVRRFLKEELAIEQEEVICGGLSLGYAVHEDMKPLARTGNRVTYFR